MNNTDRYNTFIKDQNNIWLDRFTWKGTDNRFPKAKISIPIFLKENNVFTSMDDIHNVKSLYNYINKVSNTYIKWCKTKNIYEDDEINSLKNFFKGSLGEYFFTFFINNISCMLIKNPKSNKIDRYDFNMHNICPRLLSELDYGVDLTGSVSYKDKSYDCVFQVKFWNPDNDIIITNAIAQAAYSDGILNNFISNEQNKNIFICWLGDTNKVSKYLIANELLYKHIVFIDMKVLDYSINNLNPDFWDKLKEEFIKIETFK